MDIKSEKIKNEDLVYIKEIDRGAFGVVYQGLWKSKKVAIKEILYEGCLSDKARKQFIVEAKIMSELDCPNLVKLYGYVCEPKLLLVMEYMELGSLYKVNKEKYPIDWKTKIKIALDIAKGIKFLHEKNILHRDIKSLNVLLDKEYQAKICDFGLSLIKQDIQTHISTQNISSKKKGDVGTVRWKSPELISSSPIHTKQSDIYSMGLVFYEIASREIPFAKVEALEMIPFLIHQGDRDSIPDDCPKEFSNLIKECWQQNEEIRPNIEKVISSLIDQIEKIPDSNNNKNGEQKNLDSLIGEITKKTETMNEKQQIEKMSSLSKSVDNSIKSMNDLMLKIDLNKIDYTHIRSYKKYCIEKLNIKDYDNCFKIFHKISLVEYDIDIMYPILAVNSILMFHERIFSNMLRELKNEISNSHLKDNFCIWYMSLLTENKNLNEMSLLSTEIVNNNFDIDYYEKYIDKTLSPIKKKILITLLFLKIFEIGNKNDNDLVLKSLDYVANIDPIVYFITSLMMKQEEAKNTYKLNDYKRAIEINQYIANYYPRSFF